MRRNLHLYSIRRSRARSSCPSLAFASLAAIALGGLLAGASPGNAQSPAGGGDQGPAAVSGSTWEEVQRRLPEPAKNAFQSCSLEDLTAALAGISDDDEAKDQLTRVRDAVVVVSDALVKSEEFDNAGDAEDAIQALKPAFGKLPDLTAYDGCRKYADNVLKAMAELSTPYQLQHLVKQATKSCDLGRMRSLAIQLNAEGLLEDDVSLKDRLLARMRSLKNKLSGNDRTERSVEDDTSLKDALAAISAFDAAEDALKAGDADKAEAALASSESVLQKSAIGNCEELKSSLAETRSAIAALRDYGDKLSRAATDCDKSALKDIADKLSESHGLWVGSVSDDLIAAYRTCSEQTASWRKELERDL